MSLNKIFAAVLTAVIVATLTGGFKLGFKLNADMGEVKAMQSAMDKRLERIERGIDSNKRPDPEISPGSKFGYWAPQ